MKSGFTTSTSSTTAGSAFTERIGGTLISFLTFASPMTSPVDWLPHHAENVTAADFADLRVRARAPRVPEIIAELRIRAGLTYDEIGRLLGVDRRSVHFWVSGRAPETERAAQLASVLATIRYIDRGDTEATRRLLDSRGADGRCALELLRDGDHESARRLIGRGHGVRPAISPSSFSKSLIDAHRPPRPENLLGGRDEPIDDKVERGRRIQLKSQLKRKKGRA